MTPDARFAPERFQASRRLGRGLRRHRRRRRLPVGTGDEGDLRRTAARASGAGIELQTSFGQRRAAAARRTRQSADEPGGAGLESEACPHGREGSRSVPLASLAECRKCSSMIAAAVNVGVTLRSRASTRARWRSSARTAAPLHGRRDPRGAPCLRERLGRSPTMREFAADPDASVHPQTVIEHFGTWNEARGRGRGASSAGRSSSRSSGSSARSSAVRRPCATSRRAQPDGVEVADLAHVRLTRRSPQGSRLRRAGGGGAARARDRRRRRPRAPARPFRRWPTGRTPAASHAAVRMAGLSHGRRAARRVVGVPVPRARVARGGRPRRPGRRAA